MEDKISILKQLYNEKKYNETIDYARKLLIIPMSKHVKFYIYMFLATSYLEKDNYRLFLYYKNMMLKLIPRENWEDRLKVLVEIAFVSHYISEISDEELARRHFAIQETVENVPWIWNENKIKEYIQKCYKENNHKKIRIGYISTDIYSHINLCFIIQLLLGSNSSRFDIHIYMINKIHDESTEFIVNHVNKSYDVSDKQPEEIARKIKDDEIDILVDTSIYSGAQRTPPVIAYKPAPIIIAGIGYMSTTGMKSVDYFLTDEYCDPPAKGDNMFSEKLVRLPHTHLCYTPMEHVQKFSVNKEIHNPIRFGSLNSYSKVNATVLKSWKAIMNRVPGSQLILQSNSSEVSADEMKSRLAKIGLDMNRIEMRPASIDYFATYNDIDIALDTFPYVGGGTTCDALYMGVPVVCRYGTRHGTRFSYSLLQNVGLGELTAGTWQEYEDIAVKLANDTEKLKYYHENIRNMMQSSPIMDFKGYVADVENVYIKIWHDFLDANHGHICYNENNIITEENNMAKLKNKISRKVAVAKNANKFDAGKMQDLLKLKEKMARQIADEGYVEAMDTMAEIAQEKVLDIETMCMGARCYMMTGDNERAIKWINNVLSCDKDNVQARILLGRICLLEDRVEEGFGIFEVVIGNMQNKITESEKEEMEELLEFYRYSDPDMLLQKAPHVAAFLGIESDGIEEEATQVAMSAVSAPVQTEDQAKLIEKNSASEEIPKDDVARRASEAVARLRALISKHKQESEAPTPADECHQSSEPVEPQMSIESEEMMDAEPDDNQEFTGVASDFDVNGMTMQILEKHVSLSEKIKLFNAFAAGCYVNGDYQSAFELLSAALQIDGEDEAIIKNLAYVCAAAGEMEQAMEFASKLPMLDFALLKNIK